MTRVLASLALLGTFAGCGAAQPMGGVRVMTNVHDATLLVDDELRGPVSAYEDDYLRLTPGRHRIALEHAGYVSEYIDVTVAQDMAVTVSVDMRARSEATTERSPREERSSDVLQSAP